jgi:hypothetical protein
VRRGSIHMTVMSHEITSCDTGSTVLPMRSAAGPRGP